jgi:uncharacterized protein (DUF983 family)
VGARRLADGAQVSLTVILVLVLAAFAATTAATNAKCPLWVAVILLCIVELLRVLPMGR